MTSPAKRRNILLLAVGQMVSQFGDKLHILACLAALYYYRPGSTRETTMFWIMVFAPWLIVGPVAGVFVDRWNLKWTMIRCDIIRALLVCLVPLALWAHEITFWFLYLLIFAIHFVSKFFIPARLAIVPQLVDRNGLVQANSILTSAALIGIITGLALGDVLVELFGWTVSFFVDAGTYLLSAVAIAYVTYEVIRPSPTEKTAPVGPERLGHVAEDLLRGIGYVFRTRQVLFVVISMALMMLAGGGLVNLVNVIIRAHFEAHIFAPFGMLLTAFGAGAGLGALILAKLLAKTDRAKIIRIGFLLSSLALGAFPLVFSLSDVLAPGHEFLFVILVAIVSGACVSPVMISCDTLLHEVVPQHILGRVFAAREVLLALSMIAGVGLSGLLDLFVGQKILLLVGIVGFLVLIGLFWAFGLGRIWNGDEP